MKIWANLTVEERKEMQEQFNKLYMSGDYSMVDIAKELDVSYERAAALRMRFIRTVLKPSGKTMRELVEEKG